MYKRIPEEYSFTLDSRKEHESWMPVRSNPGRYVFPKEKRSHAVTIRDDGTAVAGYNVCLYIPYRNSKTKEIDALYIGPKIPDLDYVTILERAFVHLDEDPAFAEKLLPCNLNHI